jgi:hypothetical protein
MPIGRNVVCPETDVTVVWEGGETGRERSASVGTTLEKTPSETETKKTACRFLAIAPRFRGITVSATIVIARPRPEFILHYGKT